MSEDLKKEFEEMMKLGENAGIIDLVTAYGQYKEYVNLSRDYLEEFNPKNVSTTSDSTDLRKE